MPYFRNVLVKVQAMAQETQDPGVQVLEAMAQDLGIMALDLGIMAQDLDTMAQDLDIMAPEVGAQDLEA